MRQGRENGVLSDNFTPPALALHFYGGTNVRRITCIFLALAGLRAVAFVIVTVPRFYEKEPSAAAALTLIGVFTIAWVVIFTDPNADAI